MSDLPRDEITPEYVYMNRRRFIQAALLAAGGVVLAACGAPTSATTVSAPATTAPPTSLPPTGMPATSLPPVASSASMGDLPPALAHADPYVSVAADELGDQIARYEQVTNYNNYYEFSLDKEPVAELAKKFTPLPWSVEVSGLVNKPLTLSMDDIYKQFLHEERVYRLRCVEAWSFVIPWVGFPISELLKRVEPKPEAKFVKFVGVIRPSEMPNQNRDILNWPYTEGLRLDEAMHPLAILATGMYGKPLPNQDGAPLRLVVPWKYGFKSIKAITRIELADTMPLNTWRDANAREYGFYANVNPAVNHPRWSQATERRIGEIGRRPTLPFNGYADQVASLYEGMDLKENY